MACRQSRRDGADKCAASERAAGSLPLHGQTAHGPGTARRFDGIWGSKHLEVDSVRYLYEQACEAGSDHAAVCADLRLTAEP